MGAFVGTASAPTADAAVPTGSPTPAPLDVLVAVTLVGLVAGVSAVAVARTVATPSRSRHRRLLLAMAVVVGLAALVAGHGRVVAQAAGPVVALAAQRAEVQVSIRLTGDPLPRVRQPGTPAWQGEQVRVSASVTHVGVDTARAPPQPGHSRVVVDTPVVVVAPATWTSLRPGDVVDAAGRLTLPSRPGPAAAVLLVEVDPDVGRRSPTLLAVGDAPRHALRESVTGLPAAPGGLLPSLVVGDESLLPDRTREHLRVTGLAHLTAVSGANVAIVLGAVLLVARWLGVRGRGLPVVGLASIGVFVLLARPEPSVVRASAMGVVVVMGLLAGAGPRRGRELAPLAVAVTALLLADPWLSRSIGFALSCAATAGIVLLARPWARAAAAWMPRPLAAALAVPLAAQLACTPLLVGMAGELSLSAVPANLLAAPAVPPATVLGLVAAIVGVVWPGAAHVVAAVAMLPAGWIVLVAERAASLPGTVVEWAWGVPLAALTSLAIVVAVPSLLRSPVASTVTCVALAAMLVLPGRGWPPSGWVIAACDVGQGDALALRTAQRAAIVVDVGPDPAALRSCLDDLGVESVPLLVITHLHADHVLGLDALGGDRPVGSVLMTVHDEPEEHALLLARWAAENAVEVERAVPGDAGRHGDVAWQVLWPPRVITGIGSTPNQASVVMRAQVGGVSVLLTGDIEPAAQQALLAEPDVDLDVDILKVPHHGSDDQHLPFLRATSPSLALVTVGEENTYGHPSSSTLDALVATGAVVARTDVDGAVAVVAGAGDDALRVVRRGPR